jgi:uncharacterized protein
MRESTRRLIATQVNLDGVMQSISDPDSRATMPSPLGPGSVQRTRPIDSTAASIALICIMVVAVIGPSVVGAPGIGVLFAVLVVGLAVWRRKRGLREVGFVRPESWKSTLALALGLGVALHAATLLLLDPLLVVVTGTPLDLSAFDGVRGNIVSLAVWLGIVWVLVVFLEETLFRGFLMTELRKVLGSSRTALAVNLLLASAIFGLAHWYQGLTGMLSTGVVGGAIGFVFIRNGFRLWLPILVHGVIDTVGLMMIYLNLDLLVMARWHALATAFKLGGG